MDFTQKEEDSIRDATRLHNRALRTLVKNLRTKLAQLTEEYDSNMRAVFESSVQSDCSECDTSHTH